MKKIMLGLGAICLIAFTSCKDDASKKVNEENVTVAAERDANASKYPEIVFTETEHDFGTIESKQNVETVFEYKNAGESPLVITNIASSCGCTVPQDWSKAPLAPGESGKFTVKFNGSGANNVTKTITITSNTEAGREMVKIKAFVKPDPNAAVKTTPATATPLIQS